MMEVGSYCCSSVERPLPSSNTIWSARRLALLRLGNRRDELGARRRSMIFWVGCPASSAPNAAAGTRRASSESDGRRRDWTYASLAILYGLRPFSAERQGPEAPGPSGQDLKPAGGAHYRFSPGEASRVITAHNCGNANPTARIFFLESQFPPACINVTNDRLLGQGPASSAWKGVHATILSSARTLPSEISQPLLRRFL